MAIKPEILSGWGPGGWQFYQPETNWHAPLPLANNFQNQVKNIIEMRKKNPRFNLPTDEATVGAELEAFTEARWRKTYSSHGMQKFLHETPEDKKKDSPDINSSFRLGRAVAGLAGGAVRAAVGIAGKAMAMDTASLEDWLGQGGVPVSTELAAHRASVCAPCRGNQQVNWQSLLTREAAIVIRDFLGHKHAMELSTPSDSKLGVCVACKCCMELKVWCPIEHIENTMARETHTKLLFTNDKCWVLQEMFKLRDEKRQVQA